MDSADRNRLNRQLLLKKQLHLNLNVISSELEEPKRKVLYDRAENDHIITDAAAVSNVVFNTTTTTISDDRCKRSRRQIADVTNFTIVPQQHQPLQQVRHKKSISLSSTTPSSLLKSSPTALAKFNRIIDATVPTTNVYQTVQPQQQQQQQPLPSTATTMALTERLALAYRNIVSTDSTTTIDNNNSEKTLTFKTEMKQEAELESADDIIINSTTNQMKRNDVHYLLKQLNSFSDIEEIEIVDMQNKRQQPQKQQQQQQTQEQKQQQDEVQQQALSVEEQLEKYSPTTQSLVLVSPSALSHKGIRRYASLHQETMSETTAARHMVASSLSQQLPPTTAAQYYAIAAAAGAQANVPGAAHLLQQFDDYLFQSCHYLETNYFAANYRTAMVESSSHEFRPSITTGTSGSYSSHSSLHTYDLHETEPPSVICKVPPPQQKQQQLEQQHPYAIHAQQPPALGPPARRFHMQARLTSSGVQTELTASSLSTAATNASLAKSSTISHKSTTSTSSSEAAARCRRKPFFKCCYTPIDRWRERRTAAATQKQQRIAAASDQLKDTAATAGSAV